ncbi:hypothetical protein Q7P37_007252 [Cladosporium fusiforme]
MRSFGLSFLYVRSALQLRQATTKRCPVYIHKSTRHLTNATKAQYVPSLPSIERTALKPGGWEPNIFHTSGEVKWSVIRLRPGGGEVPAHWHHQCWDYFIPLSGRAVIETKTKDGDAKEYDMQPGSFLALPPEEVHRVRNSSEGEDEEFVFLIAQAPRKKYDYVPAE